MWACVGTRGWHVGIVLGLLCVVYFSFFLFQLSLATVGLPEKLWDPFNVSS